MKISIKIICCTILLLWAMIPARAQFTDGTRGLLCMPSAEFEEDATFMITNNFLNKAYTSTIWDYNTMGYCFSINLWSRLEVAYDCVLIIGKFSPAQQSKIIFNQDRHFSARIALTKDGEWGQNWLPAIAIGCSDPITGSFGDYLDDNVGETLNGYFNRYYIVCSKEFHTRIGNISGHAGYQYSRRIDGMPTGFQGAITWNPVWLNREDWFLSKFRMTLEYDARAINVGVNASIWKDRFEFMTMLFNMRHPMFGVSYKVRLKH